ncbi:hypothetical protein ABZ815_30285 [Nonomuraea sp. NPDC047529]|uniref:hypothetical protein n=1 Tax=Nonomuraea sp. NPDC047529 TaxID=3155623 RepID=UPI0033E88D11
MDAYLRASTWLGGVETRFDRLIDQSWKTRDAGGGFAGIAVDPPRADVEVGKPVSFKVTFFGLPTAPVTWKVTVGPGAVDAAGRYVVVRRLRHADELTVRRAAGPEPAVRPREIVNAGRKPGRWSA